MHPILALVAVIAFSAAQAHAAPCPDWTTDRPGSDFWRAATVADIAGCIEAGAKVEARDKYGHDPVAHGRPAKQKPGGRRRAH